MNFLSEKISHLIVDARTHIAKTENTTIVYTYFNIGKLIIEELQEGEKRADYGKSLLKQVSLDLTAQFKRGFSVQNLERMRNFYTIYSKSSNELRNSVNNEKTISLLPLSWSHYMFFMRIDNELERQFYEIETYKNNWKLKELERQFNSGLFERLSLSKDKNAIMKLAKEGQIIEKANDIVKEPLVLEFLGLEEKHNYSETDYIESVNDPISTPIDTPISTPINILTDRQKEILILIKGNNKISRRIIAEKLKINESAVKQHLNKLKDKGIIKRIGGTRGYWNVL